MSRRETSRREFRNLQINGILGSGNCGTARQAVLLLTDLSGFLRASITVPLTEPYETAERSSEKVS